MRSETTRFPFPFPGRRVNDALDCACCMAAVPASEAVEVREDHRTDAAVGDVLCLDCARRAEAA